MNVKSLMVTIVKDDTVKLQYLCILYFCEHAITELQVKDCLWFMRVALMGVVVTTNCTIDVEPDISTPL